METLARLFVAKPLNILVVALVLLAACALFRRSGPPASHFRSPLCIAGMAWGLYAAWEWWVTAASPEADIRVDLLVIWPVLALLTAWAIFKAFRQRR
jgi:hypothetical protein